MDYSSGMSLMYLLLVNSNKSNIGQFVSAIEAPSTTISVHETPNCVPIEIGNGAKLRTFYEQAFFTLQQRTCSQIAKACIRAIETRPYNGGQATKPDWWPTEVRLV